MNQPTRVTAILLTLLWLLPTPSSAQGTDERPEHLDRRFVVDVESGAPRIWGFRSGGYLGVQLLDLTPELRSHFGVSEHSGVLVASVEDDSPAATAGLRVGDILTSIDDTPVESRRLLVHRIVRADQGEALSLEVFRDGAYQRLVAEIDRRQRPQLRLNTLDEEGHYRMSWSTPDDATLVLPSPGREHFAIRADSLDEVMGDLHERLTSPDFDARMLEFRSNTEELEKRIEELEARLLELSRHLEKLEE